MSITITQERIEQSPILMMPGGAFGIPGHPRLSFANDDATLVEGCKRLVRAAGAW